MDNNNGYTTYYRTTSVDIPTDTKTEGVASGYGQSTKGQYSREPLGTQTEPIQPAKKPKKSFSFKKVLLGAAVGLAFGICAALGFFAVNSATGFVKNLLPSGKNSSQIISTQDIAASQAPAAATPDEKNGQESTASDLGSGGTEIARTELTPAETIYGTVTDVTEVVKNVMPSVVAVNGKYVQTMNYFGQTYSSESSGEGSGIIVGENDNELLLVTNYHVVENASELEVAFIDDATAPAVVKGTNENMDLAVITVSLNDISSDTLKEIKVAQLGDSDALLVGEPVVAIGNALGYGQSVTTGVVSALNSAGIYSSANGYDANANGEVFHSFIQTDAAINPGNSGGALVNLKGQVIGINSSKIAGAAVEGLGYAIPISDAKPSIEELMNTRTRIKYAEGKQGYIGITGINIEEQYAKGYGLPQGVYVSEVAPDGGAAKAGLVRGDIIVEIDGKSVKTVSDLLDIIQYYAPGETISMTVMQSSPVGYQSVKVEVTLGERPADETEG